ncbi:MAG: paraquat-inducible protein A [Rhodobacterales bacterium]|nr:paraquat-inducible protein A [Rhodobacterales bacterium]
MAAPPARPVLAAALILLFPLAWTAPLMRAGVLPLFGLSEISVLSGLRTLWAADPLLAAVVTLAAVVAPIAKLLGVLLVDLGRLPARLMPVLAAAGRLAMADVFLIALYIVILKGAGLARVQVAWGLWLFTGCVLASLVLTWLPARKRG